ncbi:division/cell wall cluster transcriptional repressor MraZ [Komagataeibacter oboediens]|uniref:Transcriptional regulator MraZ n=2 Tax=Komagataeibacter TaxID=1434011 RepID=A0A0D6Q5Z1_KOMXY|nr:MULTISPECIES: division/cell wall cluster transcriptional repressor MraZ [Komagataeibacter]GBR38615.1 cell division protein MraZ [Komagataeibacter oboediens DSM 11826]MBV0887981.1 division/cell wall cluster transcriptional repressor MraZ [Komagataeibacter oboediens]MBV1825096.1 division/cell wall cluster transcriptional repressor MraZ [Komagataeibacter oboediens]MCK9818672.1 division/cell wall cluster transcriptional repressor MraZ [Komagataeibacter oboediens]PYD82097.1 cell division/cell wa
MSVFLGTHQNRLDAKGRVSIPSAFRTALRARAKSGEPLAILRPSHLHPCLEAWPADAFAALTRPLDEMDIFSEDHDDLATALYADAYPFEADKEGRILLPETLRTYAGLTDQVTFMGLGRTFQIWDPQAALARRTTARERARRLTSGRGVASGTGTPS